MVPLTGLTVTLEVACPRVFDLLLSDCNLEILVLFAVLTIWIDKFLCNLKFISSSLFVNS